MNMSTNDIKTELHSSDEPETAEVSERRFRRLVEMTPDAIFLHQTDGRFVYVNDGACANLGYSREDLLSMYPWDFEVNDNRDHITALWLRMVPGEPVMVEGLFRRKDGSTFPAEVRLERFEDNGQDWIVAFCRDISARRRADDALRTQERNRIARDIHDTLAHGLTAIAVQLEAARQIIDKDSTDLTAHVGNALRLARESLREARRSVQAIRPEVLESGDLAEALRQLVSCCSTGRREKFFIRLHGRPRPLPGEMESHLLRAGQEALTNVLKHAQASNVVVELTYGDTEIRLRIEDDGLGFDPGNQSDKGDGIGLTGMKERVEQIGGKLSLRSSLAGGTEVTVTVPIQSDSQGQNDED
jgi:PAS domain S-box-containing protein